MRDVRLLSAYKLHNSIPTSVILYKVFGDIHASLSQYQTVILMLKLVKTQTKLLHFVHRLQCAALSLYVLIELYNTKNR